MGSVFTDSIAAVMALIAELLLGAQATYAAAWESMIWDSGMPMRSTASDADTASISAWGSALPTSSAAQIIILRAMNRTSSPAYSILAR